MREVSGIGRYRTSVDLGVDWSSKDGAWLDLGDVGGTFRVFVNGEQLPPANQFVTRVDIGPYLKAGENQIEVVVATNLNNRLLADGIGMVGGPEGGFGGGGRGEAPGGERGGARGGPPAGPPGGGRGAAPPQMVAAAAPAEPDPLAPPNGLYLGAPVRAQGNGPGMLPGAGSPGGPRTQQDYGLIGPVRLVPYRVAAIDA